jgi:hypothetical protein
MFRTRSINNTRGSAQGRLERAAGTWPQWRARLPRREAQQRHTCLEHRSRGTTLSQGGGKEAKLSFMGHALMENRSGLIVAAILTKATGTAERAAAEEMIVRHSPGARRISDATAAIDLAPITEKFCAETGSHSGTRAAKLLASSQLLSAALASRSLVSECCSAARSECSFPPRSQAGVCHLRVAECARPIVRSAFRSYACWSPPGRHDRPGACERDGPRPSLAASRRQDGCHK